MKDVVPIRPVASGPWCAHTPRPDSEAFHLWSDHSVGVGELAAEFAAPFGGSDLLRLMGYTHDAGKVTDEVQAALRRCYMEDRRARARGEPVGRSRLGAPHKAEGAALASLLLERGEHELAFAMCMANFGHHHQIPDRDDDYPGAALEVMDEDPGRLDALVDVLDQHLPVPLRVLSARVSPPSYLSSDDRKVARRRLDLFIRMCHSALVDADFLDTAAHFEGAAQPRRGRELGMTALRDCFLASYERRFSGAPASELNDLRRFVFERSRAAAVAATADGTPAAGIYRLPAQTGCGKTMAAAAFALEHAVRFGRRRVVIAVPFTSITTQNAHAYREAFADLGDEVVLEHHSNISDDEVADDRWRRLSSANWDAEFVVTTTVQLFDSLFANRPGATRKLHRLVGSVIVLDEVQALPVRLVPAILTMLRDLTECYGVTVLLASATQPEFWEWDAWQGLECFDVIPVDEVPPVVQRVTYDVRDSAQTWEEVAEEIAHHDQVLAIVNTTGDARLLHEQVVKHTGDGVPVLHLSTRMCPAHRFDVLERVRGLLAARKPVRLISTQLIEAGVDVDFPAVYRAIAPAESIIQSAGRCNREGALGHRAGRVTVFDPAEGRLPPGIYTQAAAMTRHQFVDAKLDLGDPVDLAFYFRELFAHASGGEVDVETTRQSLQFPETARRFHMIEDDPDVLPVVVTAFGSTETRKRLLTLLDAMDADPTKAPYRSERRLLSRHTVNLRRHMAQSYVMTGPSGVARWEGEYDDLRGCVIDDAAFIL